MKTIEQLEVEHARKLAAHRRALDLIKSMPTSFVGSQAIFVGEHPLVIYRGRWNDMKGLLEDLVPQSMGEDRSRGHLSFTPFPESRPFLYAIDVSAAIPLQWGASLKLDWWTDVDGKLVRVWWDIEGPDYIGTWARAMPGYEMRSARSKKVERVWANQFLSTAASRTVSWAQPSMDSANHTYLFPTAPESVIEQLL